MIKELHISNFLSHKRSRLVFHPGLNVIVGPSDSGKSAIVRAIRWVVENRPVGDSFRSTWGGKTSVRLITNEGSVTRSKDKANKYKLNDQEFAAIRSDVPEEVQEFLDMSDVNLQSQFETHFLLSKSSGEVAKFLNKVAHLDMIDVATSNLRKSISDINRRITYEETSIAKVGEELSLFDDISIMEEKIEYMEALEESIEVKERKITSLTKLISYIEAVERGIEELEIELSFEDIVNDTVQLIDDRGKAEVDKDALDMLLIDINNIEEQLKEFEGILSVEKTVNYTIELQAKRNALEKDYQQLNNLIVNYNQLETSISDAIDELMDLEEAWRVYAKGTLCPVCGNKIK